MTHDRIVNDRNPDQHRDGDQDPLYNIFIHALLPPFCSSKPAASSHACGCTAVSCVVCIWACRKMTLTGQTAKLRHFLSAAFLRRIRTPRMEAAARAADSHCCRSLRSRSGFCSRFSAGSGNRNCIDQGLRIRVHRMMEDLLRLSDLHNFTKIHDCDPVADIIDRAESMSDKQAVSDPVPFAGLCSRFRICA